MADLQRWIEELGYRDVTTVLASGNVVFEAHSADTAGVESQLEQHLTQKLGSSVTVLVRTCSELEDVLARQPFNVAALPAGGAIYVIFVRSAPGEALARSISELAAPDNEVRVGKREVYWQVRSQGKATNKFAARLLRILGKESTGRSLNSVRRIARKAGSPG